MAILINTEKMGERVVEINIIIIELTKERDNLRKKIKSIERCRTFRENRDNKEMGERK